MKKVLIIHGWESNSKEHWFLEEKTRLEKLGYQVEVPDMPHSFFPKEREWLETIDNFRLDENWTLIGLSLGATLILRYLEKTRQKVGTCILIASPINNCGYKEVDDFFQKDFDWQKIKKLATEFIVINQKDDPYVIVEQGKMLAKNLGVNLILVEGNDHFDKIDFSLIENNL